MAKYVVAGAGPIGSAVATLLADEGHEVVLVSRSGKGPDHSNIERVSADVKDAAALTTLATGADAIFNCLNPKYSKWPVDWPPMARALEAAAEGSGAVLVTAANLYVYGPVEGPMTTDLPLAAQGPKGRVRADMWNSALALHQAGRIRATEVRGADYIGHGAQSYLERVVPTLLAGKHVRVLGATDQPHSWTFTIDMARTLVAAAQNPKAWGKPWHAVTNAPRSQRQAVDDLCDAAEVAHVKVSAIPQFVIKAMGLLSADLRALAETRYQLTAPFVIDDTATRVALGLEPTPWAEVVKASVVAEELAAA